VPAGLTEAVMAMPWFDCGFDLVYAPDRDTAARVGRVPREAVRGPYASPQAIRHARALRDAMALPRPGGRGAEAH
jgi:hypothetical protein